MSLLDEAKNIQLPRASRIIKVTSDEKPDLISPIKHTVIKITQFINPIVGIHSGIFSSLLFIFAIRSDKTLRV